GVREGGGANHLEGDDAIELNVARLEDDAHAAAADFLEQLVFGDARERNGADFEARPIRHRLDARLEHLGNFLAGPLHQRLLIIRFARTIDIVLGRLTHALPLLRRKRRMTFPARALVPKLEHVGMEYLCEDLQRFDEPRPRAVEILVAVSDKDA